MRRPVMADPAQHGLAVHPTPHGWGLFKHAKRLFESNDRGRVERALRQELELLEAGAFLRRSFAGKATAPATPRPRPRRPRPITSPPTAAQRDAALHESAHCVAAWAMDRPVGEVWIHRGGPKVRENGGVLEGFTISDWPARSDEELADGAVVCLAGPVLSARQAGASLQELMDEPERLASFGGRSDIVEAKRLAGRIGPDFARALTGEWFPGDELLSTLVYRTSRWIYRPTMTRMIEGLAGALLDEDGFGRMTSKQIDRVLKSAVPSWSLTGGKSRW